MGFRARPDTFRPRGLLLLWTAMTPLEKTFYAILLALATSFGGLVYQNAITRVAALEQMTHAMEQETKARVITDQVALTEVRADVRYMRQALDRIERKLDLIPLPRTHRPDLLQGP